MRNVFFIIVFLLIGLIHITYAFQNEPNKFRGIKWGQCLANVKGMVQVGQPDVLGVSSFKRKNEHLKIGSSSIDTIEYYAFNGKFYFLAIDVTCRNDFNKLVQNYIDLYGPPQYESKNLLAQSWIWKSDRLKVGLIWTNIGKKVGLITYEYLPIMKMRDQARDELIERAKRKRMNKIKKELGKDL